MSTEVIFISPRLEGKKGLLQKFEETLERFLEKKGVNLEKKLVGIKTHFGEIGLTTFISPVYVRTAVEVIKKFGAKPFLFDTGTLYLSGSRWNAPDHLVTALKNGFSFSTVGAPIVIADGIAGGHYVEVEVDGKHFSKIKLAGEIRDMDFIVCLTHFKGHCGTGFGGAIKNLGMGMASREGKLQIHSVSKLYVVDSVCVGCGTCIFWCPVGAIKLVEGKAIIDEERCIGCMHCDVHCPTSAIKFRWDTHGQVFIERMVEYAYGVTRLKKGKLCFVNFLLNITPDCDCYRYSDSPIVKDIGILIGPNPVALDQASLDMINKQTRLKDTVLPKDHKEGENKFTVLYPKIDNELQLRYAEELGIGEREYNIVDWKRFLS